MLPQAPKDWPWALPHLYAVNTAPDPGEAPAEASASRNGTVTVRTLLQHDRTRFEVVGYWRGQFALFHSHTRVSHALAEKEALDCFNMGRVKCLMESGRKVKENPEVVLTGEWPSDWTIRVIPDVGVFCAYLFEQACRNGGRLPAERFRSQIGFAWPPTELVMMYLAALEFAQTQLPLYLNSHDTALLADILATVKGWLRR